MEDQETKPLKDRIEEGNITNKELAEIKSKVERAELLANVLDKKMLDPILGLFEGGGDAASALAALYIIHEAREIGISHFKLARMIGRTALDFGGGSIPIVGDIFDFVYKSNVKNAKTLRKHFEEISKKKREKDLEKEENIAA